MAERDDAPPAVAAARAWLGTPYVHGASTPGAGCDCLGLVRGVWRALLGDEPESPPPYAPDWAEAGGVETLWRAAARRLVEIDPADAAPGDVLLFRMVDGCPAKHLGLRAADGRGAPTVIHAYARRGVVESPLGEAWARRVVAAFRFPESAD